MRSWLISGSFLAAAAVAACGPAAPTPAPRADGPAVQAQLPGSSPPPSSLAQSSAVPSLGPQTVDQAGFAPEAPTSEDRTPAVLRAQVLLDRARFSPGVIDGRPGENLRQAIAAFEEARGLPVDGLLDQAVFVQLTQADAAPVLKTYEITEQDVAGPFTDIPHGDLKQQAALPAMNYSSVREALAEKFHMSEALLAELNPDIDFSHAGSTLVVTAVNDGKLPATVALVEVDKSDSAVKAYDAKGVLLAFYPATIGSEDRPAPTGVLKVANVSRHPTYVFDPARLTYKQPGATTRTTLQPGPNNPVGTVWIGLDQPTFGIHGSDEPDEIGKSFSHGCVRLSNWDAEALAGGVRKGVKVSFLEQTAAGLRKAAARAGASAPAGSAPHG